MLEIRIDGRFGADAEASMRRYIAQALANVTCPIHALQLEAVNVFGRSSEVVELQLVGCCDALREAGMRAIGLAARDEARSAPPDPDGGAGLFEVVPTSKDRSGRRSSARRKAISEEWEIAAVRSLATRIAELFSKRSVNGRSNDPQLHVSAIREATGAPDADLIDAIGELEELGWIVARRVAGALPFGYNVVGPTARLFERVDRQVMGWDPRSDAIRVAGELVKSNQRRIESHTLAEELAWAPRRMNPALSYLLMHDLAVASGNVDRLFVTSYISSNVHTRRFCI